MNSGSSSTNPAPTTPVNPYQVPAEVAPELSPVFCRGTYTLDDLKVALWDSQPTSSRKAGFDIAVAIGMLSLFLIYAVLDQGIVAISILWGITGLVLLAHWDRIKSYLLASERYRRKRILGLSQHPDDRRFVLHQDGMMIWTDDMWLAVDWEYFQKCRLFSKHLQLPFALDAFRRIVLPLRFFSSPADAFRVSEFLRFRLSTMHDEKLSLEQLTKAMPPADESTSAGIVGIPTWSEEEWPFASNPTAERRFVVTDTGIPRDAVAWAKKLPQIVAEVFKHLVPFWLPTLGWTIHCFLIAGDFSFVSEHPGITLIAMIPVIGTVAITFFALWNAFQVTQSAGKSQEFRLRPEGMLVIDKNSKGWHLWSEMDSFDLNAKSAGWSVVATGDKVVLAADQFTDLGEFNSFRDFLASIEASRSRSIPGQISVLK